jgi:hypothetical protein
MLCSALYRAQNSSHLKNLSSKYRELPANKERKRLWNIANSLSIKDYNESYYENNSLKIKEKTKVYTKNRSKRDINFKLSRLLRSRLNHALKGNQKVGSAVSDLGCSIAELKIHLESLFKPGMTWDNYGEWHIDHIRPLSSFDLSASEQLKDACSYRNLQPMWAKDNLKKGNRLI